MVELRFPMENSENVQELFSKSLHTPVKVFSQNYEGAQAQGQVSQYSHTNCVAVRKARMMICGCKPSSTQGFTCFRNSAANRVTEVVPSPTQKRMTGNSCFLMFRDKAPKIHFLTVYSFKLGDYLNGCDTFLCK